MASPAIRCKSTTSFPCAAGGTNDIENGVCAEFITNFEKRAASKTLLLRHGEPTEAFYRLHATVPAELANRLERLSRLHPADYFLNNALTKMQWLATMPFWERVDGAPFKRTPEYWCRAILNLLDKWRASGGASLASRGLLPREPWSGDQALCVRLLAAKGVDEVERIAKKLTPMAEQNYQASRIAGEIRFARRRARFLARASCEQIRDAAHEANHRNRAG
jgi:hypothetical protein